MKNSGMKQCFLSLLLFQTSLRIVEAKHAEHMADTQRDISDEELDVLNNDTNEGGEDNPEEINGPDGFEDPEEPSDSLNTNSRSEKEENKRGTALKRTPDIPKIPKRITQKVEPYEVVSNREQKAVSVPSFAWEDILRGVMLSDPKKAIARWMVTGLSSGREMHCVVLRSFDWSSWSSCSASCGGGLRSRGRDQGTSREVEKEECNNFSCPKTRKPPPCQDSGCRDAFNGLGSLEELWLHNNGEWRA